MMRRMILVVAVLIAPAVAMCGASGCAKKTVTVQQTEERHESEPQMKSPGQEVVE